MIQHTINDKGELVIQEVRNAKGEPMVLSAQETALALHLQKQAHELRNALGFEIPITTLTAISKRVIEQKFFTIQPSLYLPVAVGDNAWASEIATYRDFSLGGDFATGVLNTGSNMSRLAEADSGVDMVKVPTVNWGKQITWSLPELKMAARAGNWDIVTSKERARKKNWDLGIQEVAFIGLAGNANVRGLLNQSNVNANTSLITQMISAMDVTAFTAFVAGVVQAYRANCNYTAYPTHFIIPEADYNGLAVPYSPTYPNVSKLQYLLDAFKTITMRPNFQILPLPYASQANNVNATGLNKNVYTLLNYDEDSVRMDIPVDYTNTLQNTLNGFQFQNVGYGQFSGVKAYRELEMLYFTY